jgi:hypothetical protein
MYAHPAVLSLSHTFSREDLFLVVYCLVDDYMHTRFHSSNAPRKRRGPKSDAFADSEVLTVLLVGELCQVRRERAWLRQVRASYGKLFPHLPEDSRFARRAQAVRHFFGSLRAAVLGWAGEDVHPVRILDSFPMPLCACYRIRQSSMPISGSSFGYNSSKCVYYFGLHPGLLLTERGYIDDLFLAPGYLADPDLLTAYLDACIEAGRDLSGQEWIADKGFVGQALKQAAKMLLGLTLLVRQRDYKGRFVPFFQRLLDKLRKPIEGVLSVLTENFGLEHLLVKTDIGIYRRTQAKATAFSMARYFNDVLGIAPMDIARYAV